MNDRANKFEWTAGDLEMLGKCHLCRHKFRGKRGCSAFPGEIPDEILLDEHDHTKPFPGDGGIRFDLKEK